MPETMGRSLPSTVEEIAAWKLVPTKEEREAYKEKQRQEKEAKKAKANALVEAQENGKSNLAFTPDGKSENSGLYPSLDVTAHSDVPTTRL